MGVRLLVFSMEGSEFLSSPTIVEFQSVSKYFRDRNKNIVTAVDDISFSIGKGKILGLVGQSGSGKTTAARISVALTPASKGCVLVDGIDVGKIKDRKQLWVKAQVTSIRILTVRLICTCRFGKCSKGH